METGGVFLWTGGIVFVCVQGVGLRILGILGFLGAMRREWESHRAADLRWTVHFHLCYPEYEQN